MGNQEGKRWEGCNFKNLADFFNDYTSILKLLLLDFPSKTLSFCYFFIFLLFLYHNQTLNSLQPRGLKDELAMVIFIRSNGVWITISCKKIQNHNRD